MPSRSKDSVAQGVMSRGSSLGVDGNRVPRGSRGILCGRIFHEGGGCGDSRKGCYSLRNGWTLLDLKNLRDNEIVGGGG